MIPPPLPPASIRNRVKHTHKIYRLQIIDALPKTWKDIILKDKGNTKKLVIFDHHIVRKSQTCSINKFSGKEIYLTLVDANTVKLTTKDYFGDLFESSQFNWKKIFLLIRNTPLDAKAPMFQYKVLHKIIENKMIMKTK